MHLPLPERLIAGHAVGRVTLKSLLAKKFRLLLTSISVVLGVGFMAGTFVLTDTLGQVFDDIFATTTEGVDAVVRTREQVDEPHAGSSGQETRPPVPASLASDLRAVPGVARVQGGLLGYALVIGRDGEAVQHQAPTFGAAWHRPSRTVNRSLEPIPEFRGEPSRRPRTSNEVALDQATAEDGGFRIGDRVRISFLTVEPRRFTLTGVFQFGGKVDGLAGATIAAFTPRAAQELMDRVGEWDALEIKAEPGVSQKELRDEIRAALERSGPQDTYEAITGGQWADEQSSDIRDNLSFFNIFLLVFAFISLFVGAFIIYNTFSITVTQRTRELGLLRALGASGRQVVGSVALEALAVGLISSLLGLVLGVAIVEPLEGMFRAFNIDLPSGPLQIRARTVLVSVPLGTIVTLVAAIAPARRAARVPPIAALREHIVASSPGRRRTVWGSLLTTGGLGLLALGLFGSATGGDAAIIVGVASAVVFVGVAMLSPLLVRPATRAMAAPFRGRRSITSELAQENAMRNPRRTASTAAALMVGLALVSMIATAGASAKSSISDAIDDQTRTDFVLSPTGFFPFSPEAARAVRRELPGSTVVPFRYGFFEWEGESRPLIGTSPRFGRLLDVDAKPKGGRLGRGEILVYRAFAVEHGIQAGDTVSVTFPKGPDELRVAGLYRDRRVLPFGGGSFVLSLSSWTDRFESPLDITVLIRKPTGASDETVARALDRIAARFGGIEADSRVEFKERQEAQFDQFLGLMYVLLFLSVGIALLGIANTLALSIYERTREIGLLRAVGMSRLQLRRMIRGEAAIVAVFGSVLGIAVGLLFAVALVDSLSAEGIGLTLPLGQLVTFLVATAVLGVLAGVRPARRAARLDVLEAVHAE